MDRVLGVMKAYTTRVGEGALPTEDPTIAGMLHAMGREFGATTGRARRCGWFDAVATRYATMINGIDELAITNLDGLDTVDPIKVCVAYRLDGKKLEVPAERRRATNALPAGLPRISRLEAIDRKGEKARRFAERSTELRQRIAELTGARLTMSASARPAARRSCSSSMSRFAQTFPRHVAIIMDGNGRWAKERGLPRIKGHEKGADAVRACVEGCGDLRFEFLTLYAFSAENWQRPKSEVFALMNLLERFLKEKTPELMEKNVRLQAIGRLTDLPEACQRSCTNRSSRPRTTTGSR